MEYKRVLIINATAIGENKGTGVTLHNIWRDYPRESMLQLIIDWDDVQRDEDIPTIKTPIDFCRIPYKIHCNRKKKKISSVGVANGSIKQNGIKSCLHDFFRGTLDAFPVNYDCIMDEIRQFNPEVIYTCGPSIRVLRTANYIAKIFDIPIILHMMDNWPETIYTTSILSSIFRGIVKNQLNKLHKRNKMNLAISEALCSKYSSIYGVEYKMLMNPAINIEKEVHNIAKDPKFIYAGSLNLNRWKSLLEVAETIDSCRTEQYNLEFELYVPPNDCELYGEAFGKYGALVKPYVPSEELQKIYKIKDVLVFAESFDKNVINFAKYSLSTKIPEYMATGHLILAYLPEELHSAQYLKENNLAMVASNKEELKLAILKIVTVSKECCFLQRNSLQKAIDAHSIRACNEKLLLAIKVACEY